MWDCSRGQAFFLSLTTVAFERPIAQTVWLGSGLELGTNRNWANFKVEWRFEGVNLQGTTWTSSFVKRCWGLMLYFFWQSFGSFHGEQLLCCGFMWPCTTCLRWRGLQRPLSCIVKLSLLLWILSWFDFCWTKLNQNIWDSKWAGLHISRAYYRCFIYDSRLLIIYWERWIVMLIVILYCSYRITFDAFSIIKVFQCILMPQGCIHFILLLRARVDTWTLSWNV